MESIVVKENKYYKIVVSQEKNRAYLKIIGFWKNIETVPDYLNDWKKATALLAKGFTLVTDATEMKTHPQQMKIVHEQAQAIIIKAGVKKVAEIVKDDVSEMQLNSVAKTTHFPKRNFNTIEEADKWLDE